jgi:hypothetical protein
MSINKRRTSNILSSCECTDLIKYMSRDSPPPSHSCLYVAKESLETELLTLIYRFVKEPIRYRSSFETVHVRSSQSVYSPKTTMAQTANKLLILMILYYHDNPLYCAIVAPLPRSPALQHVWKLVAQQISLSVQCLRQGLGLI